MSNLCPHPPTQFSIIKDPITGDTRITCGACTQHIVITAAERGIGDKYSYTSLVMSRFAALDRVALAAQHTQPRPLWPEGAEL